MNAFYSLFLVFALIALAVIGVGAADMTTVFGIVLPYAAMLIFVVGFAYRIVDWARSPVPFRIPTTGGQQKTLDWIEQDRFDNPSNTRETVGRMIFEVLAFRSLFRNTSISLSRKDPDNPVVGYHAAPWLWLFGLMFHYGFLLVLIRHFRFFLEPIPGAVMFLESIDSMLQIGVPTLYQTDIIFTLGIVALLLRRLMIPQVRYMSLVQDYFPLFLILGIAGSGIFMRYFAHVDIATIKEYTMSLVAFSPTIPAEGIATSFWVHMFLVCTLLVYFPFSKLMHLGGVFLSPTRNAPNDTRMVRHENPWNPKTPPHSYEAYEDDFREAMDEAGLPLEKKPEA
jgi:nitrate reductase gamma subunit